MKLQKILATALGTALVCVPGLTLAQDTYVQQITNQIQRVTNELNSQGYRMTYDPKGGQLGNGAYEDISANLTSGNDYAIVAVCDEDCTDIDIHVYDENGNLIDSDTASDDLPIVRVSPRWTGRFTVRVTMANCSNAPCYYGSAVYSR